MIENITIGYTGQTQSNGLKLNLDMLYPFKSLQDRIIEDLRRENDAAFELIKDLSNALADLGYDPTAPL